MPTINVSKSVDINASPEKVYKIISNLNEWQKWSPWLIMEQGVTVDVTDGGKAYSWNGKRVGSGEMKITSETKNKSVDYDLRFLTPWKSQADVRFELKPKGDETQVSWIMESKLPFYLFWMKNMMTAFLGSDFDRGLTLLKDVAEDGAVHSKLDFSGINSFHGCDYVGIRRYCNISEIGDHMSTDFLKIADTLKSQNVKPKSQPLAIYHKWDIVNNNVSYTAAIPVENEVSELPDGMINGVVPATAAYKLKHTGPYGHLGNAWATLSSMQRNKEFKYNKKIAPFEVYISDPEKVAANDLVTEVYFPVK